MWWPQTRISRHQADRGHRRIVSQRSGRYPGTGDEGDGASGGQRQPMLVALTTAVGSTLPLIFWVGPFGRRSGGLHREADPVTSA